MQNSNKTQNIIIIIIAAVAVIAGIVAAITFLYSPNNSSEEKEENIRTQFQQISDKFTALSGEMVEADGKTVKSDYTELQKNLFNAILQKITDAYKFVEDYKKESTISEEDYYTQLTEKLKEIQDMLNLLDNDLHTDSTAFTATFTDLKLMYETISKKMVSGDNKTLIDDYKQYQSEFDEIFNDIMALSTDAKNENQNQEYYDKLTTKGKAIIDKIKALASKANITLD